MAHAYTPGLQATPRATVDKLRELPLLGRALVKVGDAVRSDSLVLAADLPGELVILRAADKLGFEPEDVISELKVKVGDSVSQGDLLCEIKSFFGLFSAKLISPADGVIEFITEANAHLGIRGAPIPVTINGYVDGTVIEVDEGKSVTVRTRGAFIQGIFGVGGERHGKIMTLEAASDAVITAAAISGLGDIRNRILIGGLRFEKEALEFAANAGVSGVVTGSIDAETLRDFVGHEIGVSITGDEEVPFTLIVTEGFGRLAISERITKLSKTLDGKSASINGATQVRAGAMRPEIIVPDPSAGLGEDTVLSGVMEVGSKVRIIRVPYFGKIGTVTELPQDPRLIPSGAKVRVLKAKLESGDEVLIPRANVELV